MDSMWLLDSTHWQKIQRLLYIIIIYNWASARHQFVWMMIVPRTTKQIIIMIILLIYNDDIIKYAFHSINSDSRHTAWPLKSFCFGGFMWIYINRERKRKPWDAISQELKLIAASLSYEIIPCLKCWCYSFGFLAVVAIRPIIKSFAGSPCQVPPLPLASH